MDPAAGRLSLPRLLAAALSGALAAQAFPAVDLGVLAWVALVPLLAALQGVRPWTGALLGAFQGLVFFGVLVYWVPSVVARFGGLPWPVAGMVGTLLVVVLAFFHGLFGALQAWLFRRRGATAALAAPAAWVLVAEWSRLWPVGGFPWGYLGYTQYRTVSLLQAAPWGGVFGLSFLVVAVNALLYLTARGPASWGRRGRVLALGLAVLLPVGLVVAGRLSLSRPLDSFAGLRVAAVQGNVAQDVKWDDAHRESILRRHLRLTDQALAAGARLVVWAESSTVERLEESVRLQAELQARADRTGAAVLVGSVHRQAAGQYTNAAFLLVPGRGIVDRYDKIRLVPFGETVPLEKLLFFIEPLVQQVGRFEAGTDPSPVGRSVALAPGEDRPTPFGVAICYEVTYPHLVARQVRAGATFLATITNDAWFGRSSAPAQHFAMAVFRAAETRRWLVRAANTGISGIVTPRGQVLTASPLFETALVQGEIRARQGTTLAVRYPHAVPLACVILVAVFSARRRTPRAASA